MSHRNILLRPILTEKMHQLQETERKYAFQVDVRANKIDIKKAVENKFNVEIEKVRTMHVRGKQKQMTIRSGGRPIRTSGRRPNWKKAIVTLQEGFTIDLYESEITS